MYHKLVCILLYLYVYERMVQLTKSLYIVHGDSIQKQSTDIYMNKPTTNYYDP